MNNVGVVITEAHRAENELGTELLRVADRQLTDHEVHHLAGDLARWSHQHVRALAVTGRRFGLDLDPEPEHDSALRAAVRQKGSELLGRHHTPALLLLRDLRRIHVLAAGVSLDWELLAQAAQAMRDSDLLALTQRCHPQTLRQMRWANAKLKESAPQIVVTG
ncbi:hypothetical protein [Nocardia farcinica]|uniref:Uncharacterized protein n=1 Tax=Nocardia farcinica (strain IFM 10152) TaxID=247156 RepID=Q5YVP4_NOCFA|nr:hypothetical protein [Nocardia farcinica]BAD57747.1 hypothetical protein NFA_29000 [Nocardia farcinica IFM 10152]